MAGGSCSCLLYSFIRSCFTPAHVLLFLLQFLLLFLLQILRRFSRRTSSKSPLMYQYYETQVALTSYPVHIPTHYLSVPGSCPRSHRDPSGAPLCPRLFPGDFLTSYSLLLQYGLLLLLLLLLLPLLQHSPEAEKDVKGAVDWLVTLQVPVQYHTRCHSLLVEL